MVNKAELRFALWLDSIDNPPSEEEKQAYIAEIKKDPTAVHLPLGWWFAGPLPHGPLDEEYTDIYEVLHESGGYRQQLVIDRMQGADTHDIALDWAKGEIRKGMHMMEYAREYHRR